MAVAEGGSQALANALVERFKAKGGSVQTGMFIRSLEDLPPHRFALFDTSPEQLLTIAGDALPSGYRRKLSRYTYGPGAFKVDWASRRPSWKAASLRDASTVHVAGSFDEMAAGEAAVWRANTPTNLLSWSDNRVYWTPAEHRRGSTRDMPTSMFPRVQRRI